MAGTPAIALLLPPYEREAIAEELRQGGFDPIIVHDPDELEGILATRRDVTMAVLDIVGDLDDGIMCWALLHERDRNIPSLLVVDNQTLDRLDFDAPGHENDEYITRPYSPGVDPVARRGDVHPLGRRRRRQRPGDPDRHGQRRVGPPRPAAPRVQPEGRRRQDDGGDQPRRRARRRGASGSC